MKTPIFHIYTLGCKLNFSESSCFTQMMQNKGFKFSETESEAVSYYIINTCAVTSTAEKKCRTLVHHIKRNYPHSKIALMGCFSELEAAKTQLKQDVNFMVGSRDKMTLVTLIERDFWNQTECVPIEIPYFFSAYSSHDRTRSFLKIQDGCDYHCSYCTVAKARGESRSDTVAGVMQNMQEIINLGIKEVVLSGVNLGDFGRKNDSSFLELLKNLLTINKLPRIRISSIEPNLLTDEIIDLAASSDKIMPHFHIPLQSGNDRILALMKRRYNTDLYASKVKMIKAKMPFACVAADIITGFPTETDEDFEISYRFLRDMPVDIFHVFSYSRRSNTPANLMEGQVSPLQKRERTNRLIELSNVKKTAFYDSNKGKIRNVLWEAENENGMMSGFTENYIKLQKPYDVNAVNSIESVKL